jgi:site-specific recombinase XerD
MATDITSVTQPTGLLPADRSMSAEAVRRVRESVPPSTQRAYSGDARRYRKWCAERGRTPVPATPETLNEYVNHLAGAGRAPATIERALAVICTLHTTAGLGRPQTVLARASLRTYRAEVADTGRRVRKATPATTDALRAMVGTCDPATPAGVRDRALLLLGFTLCARRSELAALNLDDLTDTPDGLDVLIRRSKTDRNSAGRQTFIPHGKHPETCPVRAVRAWREVLAEHGRNAGPLFVRVDRHGKLGRAAAGRVTADGRLTGQAVALIVDRAARRAGLGRAGIWAGHSLRRGFATEAREGGADMLRIARHGGWRDGSKTLLGYIEEVDRRTDSPLVGIDL